jgi:hypothetical protein
MLLLAMCASGSQASTWSRCDGDTLGLFFPGVFNAGVCLHLVEADMRAWKECAGFDPSATWVISAYRQV